MRRSSELIVSMMRDPALLERRELAISSEGLSAEAAVDRATTALHDEFQSNALAMVRDKAPDVLDVGHRLLRCLDSSMESRVASGQPMVLVAPALTPSELVHFASQGPCGADREMRVRSATVRLGSEPLVARQPTARDGTRIHLALNASGPKEAEQVRRLGAAGIGQLAERYPVLPRRVAAGRPAARPAGDRGLRRTTQAGQRLR